MNFMEWRPEMSVGDETIDSQHKKLIEIINDYHKAIREKSVHEIQLSIIARLEEYTVYHFKHEELRFKNSNYPDYESHIQEHKSFVTKVALFKSKTSLESSVNTTVFLKFLMDWLREHILQVDRQYSRYIASSE